MEITFKFNPVNSLMKVFGALYPQQSLKSISQRKINCDDGDVLVEVDMIDRRLCFCGRPEAFICFNCKNPLCTNCKCFCLIPFNVISEIRPRLCVIIYGTHSGDLYPTLNWLRKLPISWDVYVNEFLSDSFTIGCVSEDYFGKYSKMLHHYIPQMKNVYDKVLLTSGPKNLIKDVDVKGIHYAPWIHQKGDINLWDPSVLRDGIGWLPVQSKKDELEEKRIVDWVQSRKRHVSYLSFASEGFELVEDMIVTGVKEGRMANLYTCYDHDFVFQFAASLHTICGAGTTHTALKHGVPMLVSPQAFDQFMWADFIVSHGYGRYYDYSLDYAENIRLTQLIRYQPVVMLNEDQVLRNIMECIGPGSTNHACQNQIYTINGPIGTLTEYESTLTQQKVVLKPPGGCVIKDYSTNAVFVSIGQQVYDLWGHPVKLYAEKCNVLRRTAVTLSQLKQGKWYLEYCGYSREDLV